MASKETIGWRVVTQLKILCLCLVIQILMCVVGLTDSLHWDSLVVGYLGVVFWGWFFRRLEKKGGKK